MREISLLIASELHESPCGKKNPDGYSCNSDAISRNNSLPIDKVCDLQFVKFVKFVFSKIPSRLYRLAVSSFTDIKSL